MSSREGTDLGWADRPQVQRRIRLALYAVCAGLVLIELIIHRHTSHALERIPAFYALYGFASLAAAVAGAKALRRLIGRNEGYYDGDA